MANKKTVVHVTHETVGKIGGIGAVLHGFFTCKSYLDVVDRSIIVGPLFTTEGSVTDRLGEDGEVLYSSIDGLISPGYAPAFRKIEKTHNVGIVYGRRTFIDEQTGIKSSPEVLLIDIRRMDAGIVNNFKKQLFEEFGVQSHLHEHLWEYEQYIRVAPTAIAALKSLGAANESTVIIAHEFMGMPTALAAILEPNRPFRTIFYAHEVATMRRIVEEHPGHDTMFYNVIRQAHQDKLYVNEVFGNQNSYFKHTLVESSKYCDRIYAVGDYIVDELRFLAPEFETINIGIVYNGIPAYQINAAQKLESKRKLQAYCENLLGFEPDYVFTHVTRLVKSKGLWRDLRVLYTMEKTLINQRKTAVLFLLSTEVSQRHTNDINNMESNYGWPVAHHEGWPDLSGGEANFYAHIQRFNARSRNIKIVFINQFGFNRKNCGRSMPEDMEFMDIRKGTDVEFGQSTYEPFGISQFEPLTFGGICVVSSVCGCTGFLRDVSDGKNVENVIIADYTNLVDFSYADIEDLLQIDRTTRDRTEANESRKIAEEILSRLPQDQTQAEHLIQTGYEFARNMSWDVVAKNYFVEGLETISYGIHAY
jgi:hypothetical protein